MAGTVGRNARDLIEEIESEGSAFRFFQAIRLLALSHADGGSLPRGLRFRTPASLAFPASEILEVQAGSTSGDAEENNDTDTRRKRDMTIGFMGLTGPSGALPLVYTEMLIERRHAWRDETAHRFFDMFTHRAASLFYEAWRKHRFFIGYEAGERGGLTSHLLDTAGAGLPSVRARLQQQMPESLLAHFAGLLSCKTIPVSAMAGLLRGCFGIAAEVEQFVGQWISLPASEQSRLGMTSSLLGENACAGERVWDRQMKLRVRLGPLDEAQFADMLPGSPGARLLEQLLRLCTGTSFACDAILVLEKDSLPLPVLASGADSRRLGYDAWLCDGTSSAERDDARFAVIA
ncbi:MAG TPA: type VI secretion system baseplate subunit TssG [Noviherbaspirillum sp.]|jgi:type VI secretion system protein ImpH